MAISLIILSFVRSEPTYQSGIMDQSGKNSWLQERIYGMDVRSHIAKRAAGTAVVVYILPCHASLWTLQNYKKYFHIGIQSNHILKAGR